MSYTVSYSELGTFCTVRVPPQNISWRQSSPAGEYCPRNKPSVTHQDAPVSLDVYITPNNFNYNSCKGSESETCLPIFDYTCQLGRVVQGNFFSVRCSKEITASSWPSAHARRRIFLSPASGPSRPHCIRLNPNGNDIRRSASKS